MGTSPRHCPAATLPGAESLGRTPSIDTRRPSPRLRSSSLCFSYKNGSNSNRRRGDGPRPNAIVILTQRRWYLPNVWIPAPGPSVMTNRSVANHPLNLGCSCPAGLDSAGHWVGNPCHTLVPHGKKLLSQCTQIAPPLWPIRNSSPVTGAQICSIRGPFVNPKVRESDRNTWIGPESSLIRQPGYVDSLIVFWVNV